MNITMKHYDLYQEDLEKEKNISGMLKNSSIKDS